MALPFPCKAPVSNWGYAALFSPLTLAYFHSLAFNLLQAVFFCAIFQR